MTVGSCRYIHQAAAPCSGARGEVWCAWYHSLFIMPFTDQYNYLSRYQA